MASEQRDMVEDTPILRLQRIKVKRICFLSKLFSNPLLFSYGNPAWKRLIRVYLPFMTRFDIIRLIVNFGVEG